MEYAAAMTKARDSDWEEYYDNTAGRPPRRTLMRALDNFGAGEGRNAVDLGCGDGRDTVELLRRGWRVIAIDAEPAAIERLETRRDVPRRQALTLICRRFEDMRWPKVDLVNASFALPLCPPTRFAEVWQRILRSLKPGGRFSGQLFGDRDQFRGEDGITLLDRAAVERLLAPFAVELLKEEETDTETPKGKPKHWHLFHIVARKR
jgi:SAM-dependent methyltransferase